MSFLKIKLLVASVIMFAATSAFASFGYDVNVDTTSLSGSTGYLYLQYNTGISQVGTSTATVQNFASDGVLGSRTLGAYDVTTFSDGSGKYVLGNLGSSVAFTNGNVSVNDYNQAISFGNSLFFHVELPTANPSQIAGSTFSLSLFQDALGATPLRTADGTLLSISLNADGSAAALVADAGTTATPTPLPAAAWLLGSGIMGLAGIRRRKNA